MRVLRCCCTVLVLGLIACGPAMGQDGGRVVVHASSSSLTSGTADGLSRDRVKGMTEALGFDEVQSSVALDMYRDLADAKQAAADSLRHDIQRLQQEADGQDMMSMMTKIKEATGNHQERVRVLELTFMSDLRALMTPEQEENWPKAERLHRRGKHLRTLLRAPARVDLEELVRTEFAQTAGNADVIDMLDRWSVQVDGHLVERERKASAIGINPDFRGGIFFGGGEDPYKELREIDGRIAQLGEQTIRMMSGIFGDDAFHSAWLRLAYPRVYRPLDAERRLEAALGLEDLSPSQREQLEAMAAQHARDASAARARWVEAEKEREANDPLPPGVMVLVDGQEHAGSAPARLAVRDLGVRLEQRLSQILTAEQMELLPKAEPESDAVQFTPAGSSRTIRIGG